MSNTARPSTAYGLKTAVLSSIETFAQSVAGIAPSAAPAMTAAIVYGMAGNGAWLAYLMATAVMTLTAICINEYASRSSSPGALYAYASRGAGVYGGFVTGWSMLIAYILAVSCCSVQFAVFANEVLKTLHVNLLPPLALAAGCVLLTGFVGVQNIKLSAELMLWLEIASIVIIGALTGTILFQHGFSLDFNQLKLAGVNGQGISMGLVMAMFAFVGFESAATLGAEAESPLQKIPQAMLSSVMLAGAFFIITTYAIVLGFSHLLEKLATCTTPLVVLSNSLGLAWMGRLTNIGAAVSFFACTLAMTNAGARILMTMASQGYFPQRLAWIHPKNQTPMVAVAVTSTCGVAPIVVLLSSGYGLMDIVGWLGTMSTYGYLVAYTLVSASMPFYLKKLGALKPRHTAVSTIAVLAVLAGCAGTMCPLPPAPYCWLPLMSAGYVATGLLYCRFVISRGHEDQLARD